MSKLVPDGHTLAVNGLTTSLPNQSPETVASGQKIATGGLKSLETVSVSLPANLEAIWSPREKT